MSINRPEFSPLRSRAKYIFFIPGGDAKEIEKTLNEACGLKTKVIRVDGMQSIQIFEALVERRPEKPATVTVPKKEEVATVALPELETVTTT